MVETKAGSMVQWMVAGSDAHSVAQRAQWWAEKTAAQKAELSVLTRVESSVVLTDLLMVDSSADSLVVEWVGQMAVAKAASWAQWRAVWRAAWRVLQKAGGTVGKTDRTMVVLKAGQKVGSWVVVTAVTRAAEKAGKRAGWKASQRVAWWVVWRAVVKAARRVCLMAAVWAVERDSSRADAKAAS